jgi:hypothetical protein
MGRSYFVLIALIISCHSFAQPYLDLASAYFSYSPGKGLNNNSSLHSFHHFRAQVNAPVVFKKDSSVLLFNPVIERRWIGLDENGISKEVNGLFMLVSFTKKINNRWSVMFGGIPRWNGESGIAYGERFQMGGVFWVTRTIHPELKIRAGLYYNKEFFGNFFMPVLGIEWKINKSSYLFGNLPSSLTYENRINSIVSLGGVFRTFPNSYRITPLTAYPSNDYYRTTDIQLGGFMDLYITKKIVFNLEAGYSVVRKLMNGQENGGGRNTELTLSDKGNFYLRCSLQYRLRFY